MRRTQRGIAMRPLIFMLLLAVASASAADDLSGISTYPASYFADAAPATAADMLARLPGFRMIDADDEVRGYAAAQGNVLIDGARPTSKRESLDDLLARIPAHAVERIELIRAGASGYDLLGQPMLANVVRVARRKADVAVEAGARVDGDGGLEPSLQLERSLERGDREFEFALGSEPELDEDSGDGRVDSTSPAGDLQDSHASRTRREQRLSQATAKLGQATAGGRLAAFGALRDTRDTSDAVLTSMRSGADDKTAHETEHLREAEFGLQCTHLLGASTSVEAIASHRAGWLENRSSEIEGDGQEFFTEDTRSRESLARVDLQHARTPSLSVTAGVELAINALDGDATLLEDGEVVELPGSRVRIEERRGDASIGAQWSASDRWRLEGGLALERSRIRQAGDSALVRDFSYVKPSLAARLQRSDSESWRFSLARSVGQLAFEDFVASASLDTDTVTAGNAQLEPDKTWRVALAWERTFAHDGAIALTLAHDQISDVVDLVPVEVDGETLDAPGNIGDGTRDSLALAVGTSLDAIGWPTVRVDADVLWQRGRVRDPATGVTRDISGEAALEGEIALSQTLATRNLKWGLELELAEREREYRVDEVTVERVDASLAMFVERSFHAHWRVRAELVDPFGRDVAETRERHDGARATQPLDEIELRRHRVPPQLLLTLRRDMGG
jgi:hypothetical protein